MLILDKDLNPSLFRSIRFICFILDAIGYVRGFLLDPKISLNSNLKTTGKKVEKIIKIGPPKLTRFERARIVGARSLQIALGAPLFIQLPKELKNSIELAIIELKRKALPISIRRTLPNGIYQDIPLDWLSEEE